VSARARHNEGLKSELVGLWRLVEAKREYVDTGETVDMFGPNPTGYLMFAPGGRMMALLTAADRVSVRDQQITAYAGTYSVDGNSWVTDVDVAWTPDWLGTKQSREFVIEDGELRIRSMEMTHPQAQGRRYHGLLRWRRADDFG
jgi:hypothetical protein